MAEPLLRIGAAYIRVSDERQDEYTAKEGYQIPDDYVFYDDGISGKLAKLQNMTIKDPPKRV